MVWRAGVLMLLPFSIGGCAYDYLNNSDFVTKHAGDAVQANLERETLYPAGYHSGRTTLLGSYGGVIPSKESGGDYTGNCLHNSDTAADGSICGGRSADSRPGGASIQ